MLAGYGLETHGTKRAHIQASMKNVHSARAITGPTRGAFETAIVVE